MFEIGLTICVICLIAIIRYIVNLFTYWKKRNVPYIPLSLPSTTTWIGHVYQNHYNWGKQSGFQHIGVYTLHAPTYMPIDISIVKNILSTDFQKFSDRGVYYNEKVDPMGANLFTLQYAKWKQVRGAITPTFTASKMKMMFDSLVAIGGNLKDAVSEISCSGKPVDIRQFLQCFTMDVIGSCAFGLDCNSFKNPDSEFRKYGINYIAQLKSILIMGFIRSRHARLAKLFKMRTISKDLADFYLNITRDTIEYRKTNNVIRNDFLQLMMNLENDPANNYEGLTTEDIAAQCLTFYVAGYETSSSTLCYCFYELSLNPEIQERARDEINSVLKKYGGQLTYEAAMEMQYAEQIVNETLRKYPIVPALNRICNDDYQVPNTDLLIEKDTLVAISVIGIQHDPDHFPNPEVFDPERFSHENKSKIKPFTYLPFGDGPRNCIGLRFALLEVKVAVVILLRNFRFSINENLSSDLSKMNPEFFTAAMTNTMWLNVTEAKN